MIKEKYVREKYINKKKKELLEFVKLMMETLRQRYNSKDIVINKDDVYRWEELLSVGIGLGIGYCTNIPTIMHFVEGQKVGEFPSEKLLKWHLTDEIITPQNFEVIKWGLDGIADWLGHTFAQANKNTEGGGT